MIEELYKVITAVYEKMHQTFEYPLENITTDTKIKELGIDSLGFIMIMMEIEDHFGIHISSEGITSYETVQDIINMIEPELNK